MSGRTRNVGRLCEFTSGHSMPLSLQETGLDRKCVDHVWLILMYGCLLVVVSCIPVFMILYHVNSKSAASCNCPWCRSLPVFSPLFTWRGTNQPSCYYMWHLWGQGAMQKGGIVWNCTVAKGVFTNLYVFMLMLLPDPLANASWYQCVKWALGCCLWWHEGPCDTSRRHVQ